MKTNEIEITRNGSVISNHPDGVICTYDSQHRILKVPMEDGSIFELFQERADSDTIRAEYRTERMTMMAPPRGAQVQARLDEGRMGEFRDMRLEISAELPDNDRLVLR